METMAASSASTRSRRAERPPVRPSAGARSGDPAGSVLRWVILAALLAAPLALGSVHEAAFIPLLAVSAAAGLAATWRAGRRRAAGETAPDVAGSRLLIALHALAVVQLVPLPPILLRLVSPGSFAFYDRLSLVPLAAWRRSA